jgi:hypothetical protein
MIFQSPRPLVDSAKVLQVLETLYEKKVIARDFGPEDEEQPVENAEKLDTPSQPVVEETDNQQSNSYAEETEQSPSVSAQDEGGSTEELTAAAEPSNFPEPLENLEPSEIQLETEPKVDSETEPAEAQTQNVALPTEHAE